MNWWQVGITVAVEEGFFIAGIAVGFYICRRQMAGRRL